MGNMFKNYPQPGDYIPDNHPKFCEPFKLDIMTGETAIHSFEIPFNVITDCEAVEVIYNVGINIILSRITSELDIHVEENNHSIITCTLSSDDTMLFRNTLLDTQVQIKFTMRDKKIVYSDIYPVHVVDSLEATDSPAPAPTPIPGTLGGLGYTED